MKKAVSNLIWNPNFRKTFHGFLGSCISSFDDHFPIFSFNYLLVILSLGTAYPELQRVIVHIQLRC